jgi:predicted nucleotidyltransferase
MPTVLKETESDRHARYLATLRDVVRKALAGTGAQAWLFGSRATGTAWPGSDVDIAVDAPPDMNPLIIADLREALDDTAVPWVCDVVDLRRTSDDFRGRVYEEGVPWTE